VKYSGSDTLDRVAVWKENSDGKAATGGSHDPNALGLYDLSGNVWEWVWDWYAAFDPATADGPEKGKMKILRGGGFNTGTTAYYSVTNRGTSAPVRNGSDIGFRVVRSESHR
jgi:formylglycine-generating enzyme required for sulfatase activity